MLQSKPRKGMQLFRLLAVQDGVCSASLSDVHSSTGCLRLLYVCTHHCLTDHQIRSPSRNEGQLTIAWELAQL